ncbi:hypothetical protein RIF29_37356 [Crotalaria pallida]|uniref:Uncharacterized protein n=1 Tax=Crotalaria pallida TaxID=3830 RepID=A0AAN9HV45_CROPI
MGQCASRRTNNNNNNNNVGGFFCREGGSIDDSERQRCFAMMIKEHKSRFYIAKRCIVMLICWHKYG